MKKRIIHIIFILFLCLMIAKPVFAFAGGGGANYNGGGGNGHTGGGTTNNDWSNRTDRSDQKNSHPLSFLFPLGVGVIIFLTKRKKYHATRDEIAILDYQNPEEVAIDQFIEKIFYPIQTAWQNQNLLPVEKYYSKDLLKIHKKKIDKMKNKQQKNIIEDLVLRKVGNLQWIKGRIKFSVEIEARAIDYVIDTRSGRVLKGKKEEYGLLREKWFFEENGANSWLLYKIK